MSIPVVTFPDPVAAAITALTDALAGRSESCAQGVKVFNHRPGQHQAPAVQVNLDGDSPRHWPVLTRPMLRVTAWHILEQDAYDLAQLCQALLLAHAGGTLVRCDPAAGPVPGADPDTGDSFATFSIHGAVRSTVA
jgi:hypothetical protein